MESRHNMSTITTNRRPSASAPWWATERQVNLTDAPPLMPPMPGGNPRSVDTVRRYVRAGVHGIRLRVFASGSRGLCTTVEEINRFLAALSSVRGLDG